MLEIFALATVAIACRFVILGNHRDAWTFGAVDPNSGTAALLEVTMDLFVRIVLSIYVKPLRKNGANGTSDMSHEIRWHKG